MQFALMRLSAEKYRKQKYGLSLSRQTERRRGTITLFCSQAALPSSYPTYPEKPSYKRAECSSLNSATYQNGSVTHPETKILQASWQVPFTCSCRPQKKK